MGGASCLVTSPIDVAGKEDSAPVIRDDPGASPEIGSIVWLNSETTPEWTFSVLVYDEDISQTLNARWRLVTQNFKMPSFTQLELAPGQNPRPLVIRINRNQLSKGECHHLELAVSGSFITVNPVTGLPVTEPSLFRFPVPGREDDLALASWWLWEGRGSVAQPDEKVRLVESCAALETLLGTPSAIMEPPQ
jgi:hypothetical protein